MLRGTKIESNNMDHWILNRHAWIMRYQVVLHMEKHAFITYTMHALPYYNKRDTIVHMRGLLTVLGHSCKLMHGRGIDSYSISKGL